MDRYKARENFIRRQIADDIFLVPTGQQIFRNNGLIVLNETADLLWSEIQSPKTVEELCAAVAENYETDTESVETDVREFIGCMMSLDALETV